MSLQHPVIIYTDGAALGNPGPGGFGIVMLYGDKRKEISEGYRYTTNNRMELLAVIVALESLKKEGLEVMIHSDSQYVVNSIEKKWVHGWMKKGFKGKKNEDLWRRYMVISQKHKVIMKWVRGHIGIIENERWDELSVAAALDKKNHKVDTWYEKNES
jgi:ribonuclease HI